MNLLTILMPMDKLVSSRPPAHYGDRKENNVKFVKLIVFRFGPDFDRCLTCECPRNEKEPCVLNLVLLEHIKKKNLYL